MPLHKADLPEFARRIEPARKFGRTLRNAIGSEDWQATGTLISHSC
jgi:hypothetical protein